MESHKEVYFMGRIAAATTHELKNIFAIIKETLGLLEDLVVFSKNESVEQYKEWLKKALKEVTSQVSRGIALVQHYNRFAHIPDHPVLQINVRDSIQHLITLCAHLIRLRQVKVEQEPPLNSPDISLVTCPLYFYMAIFSVIDKFMEGLPTESTILVKADKVSEYTIVSFRSIMPEGKSLKGLALKDNSALVEFILDVIEAEYSFDEIYNVVNIRFRDLDPDDFVNKYFSKA